QLPFHVAFSQLFLHQSKGIPFGGGRVEECLGFALAFRADSAEADHMLVSTDTNLPEFVRTASNKLETAFPARTHPRRYGRSGKRLRDSGRFCALFAFCFLLHRTGRRPTCLVFYKVQGAWFFFFAPCHLFQPIQHAIPILKPFFSKDLGDLPAERPKQF